MEKFSEEAAGSHSLMDKVLKEVGKFFFMDNTKEVDEESGRLSYVGDSMTINLWPVTAFGGVVVMCEYLFKSNLNNMSK